jgi:hypothetical protein
MRRFGWFSIIGAVLFVAGLVLALCAGPDDCFDSPAQSIDFGEQVAAVTNYGVISSTLPVRITATSDTGETFIGIGHAIDVDDYLSGLSVTRIDGFSALGLTKETVKQGTLDLPAAPTGLDFWQSKAVGAGTQQVSGQFTNQPVQAVITTVGSYPTTVVISIGAYLPGSFAASVALAALGAALIGFDWWRRGRRIAAADQPADQPPPDNAETTQTTTTAPRHALRTGFISVCTLSLLSTSGCSAPISTPTLWGSPPPREQLTRNPGAGLDLVAFAADYDRRNNAAIKASAGPTYSAAEWASADGEPVLGIDRFSTAWSRETKAGPSSSTCQTTIKDVYSTQTRQYPLSLVTTRTFVCDATEGEPYLSYATFVRDHSYSPWKLAADTWLDRDASVPKSHAEPAGESQQQAAMRFAEAFADNLTTGGAAEPKLPANVQKARNFELAKTSWSTSTWSASVIKDQVCTVRTERGTLAVVPILIRQLDVATKGGMYWEHPWDRIRQQTGTRTELISWLGLVAVIEFGDTPNAVPTIPTWNYYDYLPA